MKRGIYPGTFDPITYGHLDIVLRSIRIFDEVVIAVAPTHRKQPLFTLEERIALIRESVRDLKSVHVEPLEGLLVSYAKKRGGVALIRGLRAVSDYEYELQMALMNRRLDQNIETVFLMSREENSFVSSTIVREVASFGGTIKSLVPPNVARALKEKFSTVKKKHGQK
ncbi:MAG TPA: pantetheine-phosphate adenylyltransferase [Dissulfurispiraceae bacterium]|nr:pantetheine-phosphate adenylyltransferase [Dissulfurispiraceae bacterium]